MNPKCASRSVGGQVDGSFGLAIIAFRRIVLITKKKVSEADPINSLPRFSQEVQMSVRVIIERQVEPGQEAKLRLLMTQARGKATNAKGYISGETLRALDDPNKFIVISNWNSAQDWKAWEKDPERVKLRRELEPLLMGKEKCTVYTHL
jgi:heme-degrading monooxygenase HmoA